MYIIQYRLIRARALIFLVASSTSWLHFPLIYQLWISPDAREKSTGKRRNILQEHQRLKKVYKKLQ